MLGLITWPADIMNGTHTFVCRSKATPRNPGAATPITVSG